MDAIIFDMDGTLCDVSTIRHLVHHPHRNFQAFHEASVDCPAHDHVAQAARRAHADGQAVLIVTARKFKFRFHTTCWLREQNIPFDDLFMRDDRDQRQDALVKADILASIRRRGFNVVQAWDDNPSVIDLWTRNGIPVQVVPGWDN